MQDVFLADLSSPLLGADQAVRSVEQIHQAALAKLGGHLADFGGEGSNVLLLSPRAGFGKSQLLARLAAARWRDCFFIPLEVNRDSRPSWVGFLQGVVAATATVRRTPPLLCFLESLGRKLMAEATVDLILRGDIPSGDPAGAIALLKRDYLRAFDLRAGESEVARWIAENFNALLPLMGEVLGSRTGVGKDEAVAWLRVLSRFNAGNPVERRAALASVVIAGDDDAAQASAKQRLRSLCRLAALERRLVLVFDHVDALAAGKKDAMQLACMLAEFGRLQFGVGAILSVNGDVWGASLDGHLPGALEDRLTSREVKLRGIGPDEAESLLRLRLKEAGLGTGDIDRFLGEAKLAELMERRWAGAAAPREVLRHAAAVWDRLVDPPAGPHGSAPGEPVKVYLPGKLPAAESLAGPSTLRPMREVIRHLRGGPEPAPAEPGKVDPGTIKQMGNISSLLRELKSRREQFVPHGTNTAPEAGATPPQLQVVDEADENSPLVRRFEEIREALLQKRGQRLDLEALRRMVSLAGERFPVVAASDFKMSPGDEPTVTKWLFPGNEILFGFEPEHQFRYWQSLIKLAGRRSGSATGGRLKLVIFSEHDHPFSGAASVDLAEFEAARGSYVDVIDLDAGMIASVIAADRVVCEMAKAQEPVLPADAIRELAPQLDPLWRRITRPLGTRAV